MNNMAGGEILWHNVVAWILWKKFDFLRPKMKKTKMFHGGGGISDINMICILSGVEMSRIL